MRKGGAWLALALAVGSVPFLATGSWPGTGAPSSHSGADPLVQSALLEWALRHPPLDPRALHAPFFWPEPYASLSIDPLWGQALLARTMPAAARHPEAAYAWVLSLTVVLAFAAVVLLGRRIGLGAAGAALAGVVYALGPYAAGQWHHLNQLASPWIPLALVALDELLHGRRPVRGAAVLVAAAAMQLSSSVYGSAALAIGLLAWTGLRGWGVSRARRLAWMATAGVMIAMAWLWGSLFARAAAAVAGYDRDPSATLAFQARVFDLWKVGVSHLLPWPGHDPTRPALYPGLFWGLLAATGAAHWLRDRRDADAGPGRALLAVGAAGLILSFGRSFAWPGGPDIPMPLAWAQDHLWPLRALRDPSRLAVLFSLFLSLAGVHGWQRWRRRGGRGAWLVLVLALLDLAPGRGASVRLRPDASEEELLRSLRGLPAGAVWGALPVPCRESEEGAREARRVRWAVRVDRPLAGGAAGFVPESELRRRARCGCGDPHAAACLEGWAEEGIDYLLFEGLAAPPGWTVRAAGDGWKLCEVPDVASVPDSL